MVNIDLGTSKTVTIVGLAATGKTSLSYQLKEQYPKFKLFHADDYVKDGKLFNFYQDIINDPSEYQMAEGIMCYHLLLKGFNPDMIIEVVSETTTRIKRAMNRGTSVNLGQQDAMVRKLWLKYLDELETKEIKPAIVQYKN